MFNLQFSGGDELARTLRTMPDAVGKKTVSAALQSGAEPIRGMAQAIMARGPNAPHAAEHVIVTLGKSGHSIAIGPSKDFFYWLFQEMGTARHPAQPAMRPAFDAQGPGALGIIGRQLWAAVKTQAESGPTATTGGRFL